MKKSTKDAPATPAPQQQNEDGRVVKFRDAAKRIGLSYRTVLHLVKSGYLEGWRSPTSKKNVGVWGPSLDAFMLRGLQLSREARAAERADQAKAG